MLTSKQLKFDTDHLVAPPHQTFPSHGHIPVCMTIHCILVFSHQSLFQSNNIKKHGHKDN